MVDDTHWAVGPKDPFHPTTDVEVIFSHHSGAEVVRQGYDGGYLYEYKVPDGLILDREMVFNLRPPFRGRMAGSWYEEGTSFLDIWLPNEDQPGG